MAPPNSVLNPFSVYRKGEGLLRDQLRALSSWHLVNIILDHELTEIPVEELNRMMAGELIELIVSAVRASILEGAVTARNGDI